jgi:meso-butanediol dehydrogenase/(S,S)-butanediol dehydrogenase/diacetyl reductase
MRLRGKVAVVTGGGTGIGKGVSKRRALEGARLEMVAFDALSSAFDQKRAKNVGGFTAAREVTKSLSEGGASAIAIECDVTNKGQVASVISGMVAHFGKIDLVGHCASVIAAKKVADLTEEDGDSIMTTNAKGTFLFERTRQVSKC